jgi:hypothetical protein
MVGYLKINKKSTQSQKYKEELIKKIAKVYEEIRYYRNFIRQKRENNSWK